MKNGKIASARRPWNQGSKTAAMHLKTLDLSNKAINKNTKNGVWWNERIIKSMLKGFSCQPGTLRHRNKKARIPYWEGK